MDLQHNQPPVEGMTRVPFGLPLMMDAWMGCVGWVAEQEGSRKDFFKQTGYNLESLVKRSPIEVLIDKSNGYERKVILSFLDYVTEFIWGEADINGNKKELTRHRI